MMFFNKKQPLYLPEGTGRLILALFIVGFCLSYFWVNKCFPGEVLVILGTVTGYYLGSRNNGNGNSHSNCKPK